MEHYGRQLKGFDIESPIKWKEMTTRGQSAVHLLHKWKLEIRQCMDKPSSKFHSANSNVQSFTAF